MNIIPYSFRTVLLPETREEHVVQPGVMHGVHIACDEQEYQWLLDKIMRWFAERDEVILIEHGPTVKRGHGFLMLEWEECRIDPLFLTILQDEPCIEDVTTCTRKKEN